jgi:hypothetical protein
MTKFTVRILAAVITFAIGVAIATAWVFDRKEEPTIAPVQLSSGGVAMEMVFCFGYHRLNGRAAGRSEGADLGNRE